MKRLVSIYSLMFAIFLLPLSKLYAQWVYTNGPLGYRIDCFAVSGTNLFVGCGDEGGGIYLSTNNGANWNTLTTPLIPWCYVTTMAVSDTNLFARYGYYSVAGIGGGVIHSTDNGSSWTFCSGVANASIGALAVSDSNLFVSTVYDGTYRSTNNGISFKLIDVGNYDDVTSLAFAGSNIYAGTFNGSNDVVFLSTNSGTDWIVADSGLPVDDYVVSFGASGTNLFAGTYTGSIFLSANNGTSWNAVNTGLTNMTVNTFVVSGTNIFAGTQGGGVLLSINNGAKWTQVNTGLMDTNVYALAVSGHDLFAGTGHGVWRRSLNDMVTVVKENSEIPVSLSLLQNYPDPFNPTTTISFTIPSRSSVSLKIFDILGREVATIVSQELPAGTYSRQWNAAKMSSGIYFYRLQAGSFTQTKRLVLLK